jgi:bacillithiol synthase
MNLKSCSPEKLPFPRLFQDYLNRDKAILNFFEYDPFLDTDLERRISDLSFNGNRNESVRLLNEFNDQFRPPSAVLKNIEKLAHDQTFAIVTGQQATIFGGPIFTIYKTLTVLRYSILLNKKFDRTFIPVFWLADEDHDFDEIASIGLPSDKGIESFKWEPDQNRNRRVSDITLNGQFHKMYAEIKDFLKETDFSSDLWDMINDCYQMNDSATHSFGKLLLNLFGDYGLVLAGSNHKGIKEYSKTVLIKAVEDHDSLYSTLNKTTGSLEKAGYHSQVVVQPSNLFRISDNGTRSKLNVNGDSWSYDADNSYSITTKNLVAEIENQPERFSPNVFLRPVLQDYLLPTFGYVGGPGEISYYAQTKEFYRFFDLQMPVLFPRYSCTIIENPIEKALEHLPFEWYQFIQRIEELESDYVKQSNSPDIDKIINLWKKEVNELTERMKPRISEIDPTLENTAGKASATYFSELDKLKGKMYRSVKQQQGIQLNRISKVKHALFPNNNLQEREVAFIYFMNKYGTDIWDKLFEILSEHDPSVHFTVEL